MTVGQLKTQLDQFDDETPIRLALQPNYPMLGSIQNVCNWINSDKSKTGEVCLIACSDNEDYGCPREAWNEREIEDEED